MVCILLFRKQLHPNGTKPGKNRKNKTSSTDELGQQWPILTQWKTCQQTKVLFLQHTYVLGVRQFS